jgi:hypothetical protein
VNLLILIGVGAGGLFALWLVQTATLLAVRARPAIAWPLKHGSESQVVRLVLKAAVQGLMLALLLLPPWLIGESPWAYHVARLTTADWQTPVGAGVLTLALFWLVMLVNRQMGWVTFEAQLSGWKLVRKLVRVSLTPIPLATMEELVFRGIILEQMLCSFPATPLGEALALTLAAAVFASVHFLRPAKQVALPALGLFVLGWVLGYGYILAGHTIWVPVACHAAGVWFIQTTRPFASYHGPAWLIGYRSYPNCGAYGMAIMAILVAWVFVQEAHGSAVNSPPQGVRKSPSTLIAAPPW